MSLWRLRAGRAVSIAGVVLGLVAPAAAQGVAPKVQTYAVDGATGIELYESIGRNGPTGAIAQTRYTLTWNRLFDEEAGDCRLIRLEPKLSITIILPKPAKKLSPHMQSLWEPFVAGMRKHEDVHAAMINETVAATRQAALGAIVQNDKNCAKVKREVSRIIDENIANYKARSRDFDQTEFNPGGNVHRLILTFVNEGRSPN